MERWRVNMSRQFNTWASISSLSIIFFSFQNFTSLENMALKSHFVAVEMPQNSDNYKLIFANTKAHAIINKMQKIVPIKVERPIYSPLGKLLRKDKVSLFRGQHITCAQIHNSNNDALCWTLLNKNGNFTPDMNFPQLQHHTFLRSTMPLQHINGNTILDYVENNDFYQDDLVFEISLTQAMSQNIKIDYANSNISCSNNQHNNRTAKADCYFQVNELGQIFTNFKSI